MAVSAPLGEYLATGLHIPRSKISIIQNGVRVPQALPRGDILEARAELGIDVRARVIGSLGRFQRIKGYHRLIDAFAMVRDNAGPEFAPIVLLLAGDGPERAQLEAQVSSLDLGDFVKFVGWRNDTQRLLELMDVFVLPSDSEGTSLALLEAMASGTAVVATAVGGTPDVIGSSEAGRLIAPGNTRALAGAILESLADGAERQAMGLRGRARIEQQFSFEAMARAYLDLYKTLIHHD